MKNVRFHDILYYIENNKQYSANSKCINSLNPETREFVRIFRNIFSSSLLKQIIFREKR